MKLIVSTPTYKRFDLCVKMIENAMLGSRAPDAFIILDNGAGGFTAYLKENGITLDKNTHIVTAAENLGVAAGWNALIGICAEHFPDDILVIVNDDICFDYDALEKMERAYQTDYVYDGAHNGNVYCAGGIDAPNAFSFFMFHPKSFLDTFGPFDETIYPAYFDDNDMYYRMRLQGKDLIRVPDVTCVHNEGGSATLKSFTEEEKEIHHNNFRRNSEYYVIKWGGSPGNETYIVPFNGHSIVRVVAYLQRKYGF